MDFNLLVFLGGFKFGPPFRELLKVKLILLGNVRSRPGFMLYKHRKWKRGDSQSWGSPR